MKRIGVLALQGAFIEHIKALRQLRAEASEVRLPSQMDELDALVIPGGESTTMVKLLDAYGLRDKIAGLAEGGLPVFGTCAGMILLAAKATDLEAPGIGVMDINVKRNAFGRQVDSFETALRMPALGETPFPAVFIRAPLIESVGKGVEVLARLPGGEIVAARQRKLLASAFHPELTPDLRFHQYFLTMVDGS
ncbi:MAG: pyridoxal 5'-phosphate synthase glutaminase subunit PdxT [Chloroflexi bacterium]|nr:pyridoxal 5'-phosphate synthase glutaminase subunit PdxT [Chloroflexota bacterium]